MKPRRDITLGEMQDECRFRGRCCETIGGEPCEYYGICNQIRTKSCLPPEDWDLTDPPRFNEQQMAFWRGWYEIGARRARRNGTRIYLTLDNGDYFGSFEYGCISDKVKHGLREEEILVLAELLGKENNEG